MPSSEKRTHEVVNQAFVEVLDTESGPTTDQGDAYDPAFAYQRH